MGNVLGINLVDNTVYLKNNNTKLDTLYEFTIYSCVNKAGSYYNVISNDWTMTPYVNSENSNKLDFKFVYNDINGIELSSIYETYKIGSIGGLGHIFNNPVIKLGWKRNSSSLENISIHSDIETSLIYSFAKRIYNNHIQFTSRNYLINYDNTCLQENLPVINNYYTSVTEDGHKEVILGSVTLGKGKWIVIGTGSFDLENKKYFYFSDQAIGGDYGAVYGNDYFQHLASHPGLSASFSIHYYSTPNTLKNNNMPIKSLMVYDSSSENPVISWCTTCESSSASKVIFDPNILNVHNDLVNETSLSYSVSAYCVSF